MKNCMKQLMSNDLNFFPRLANKAFLGYFHAFYKL